MGSSPCCSANGAAAAAWAAWRLVHGRFVSEVAENNFFARDLMRGRSKYPKEATSCCCDREGRSHIGAAVGYGRDVALLIISTMSSRVSRTP